MNPDYLYEMEYEAYVDSWEMPLMSFEDWKEWRAGVYTSMVANQEGS